MKKLLACLIISSLGPSAYASSIKSKPIDSSYSSSISQDHLESMQREIQSLTSKVEKLEKMIIELQNKTASLSSKENHDAASSAAETTSTENAEASEKAPETKLSKGSEKQIYDAALSALKGNDYSYAIKRFEDFIQAYPNSQLIGNAYFWYGETLLKSKAYNKAALYFLKSYKQAPKGPKSQDSLLKLATTLKELKKNSDACSILNKLDDEFPSRTETSVKRSKELRTTLKCK